METNNNNAAPTWAILELMGHVKTGALISKDTQFGTALLRAEVPQENGTFITQLINPSSLYRVTICEEKLACACAASNQSQPLNRWEVQHLLPTKAGSPVIDDHRDDDDADNGF